MEKVQRAMEFLDNCAWCESPKTAGPLCSSCGADYAKAEAIKLHGKVQSVSASSDSENPNVPGFTIETSRDTLEIEDPALEKKLCIYTIPAMLTASWLVQFSDLFASLQRIVLGMPVHELGHATVAWFCGFNAIPTVWKTLIPNDKGIVASILVFAGIVALANYGRRKMKSGWIVLAGILLALQGYGTFILGERDAKMYFIFGGDGGGMVLATLLMITFYFGKETQLYKGNLRWGFVFIGSAAFVDMFMTWVRSLSDRANVPYGLTGGEPTDAYKLIHNFGWSWEQLISRHVSLGIVCLLVLLTFYLWGIKQANQMIKDKELEDQRASLLESSDLTEPADSSGYSAPSTI